MNQDIDYLKPETIQEAIQLAEATQEQLARNLGVSLNTVNSWVNCRKMPRADNFFALCRELKLSPKTVARLLRIDISNIPDDIPLVKSPSRSDN
ncbi:MAG: helix-turn-helix transcriptional regulator [Microcoleus sp. PH2017_29_MFU_D_A]|jgi:transcriptional regulator with XRE-family HTH domain|uniref:helix-turn-helix domain-containing protein n=1 Tax=unclassified Microcoleus TaxID=2642155 RepID=UPI001D97F9C3|nr:MULTISPECIES: helix-turn-helix transcriptional regulator [unclassified Microcoleus]MCC3422053.1 helix-turn-helix transcriptional regulator [Microcoleus sp. PH2017_07_MST_O_A]MCC3432531.1 helix-turn-helix transcriptional regulator [Microcoleus sp. PH2017_04_SCI_O_A]MCC3443269.1 helix-turn-helix transcriptional regulator [Microcoleus sp. PH2017_03_ELD_O_A]MCC3466091.1 helix-turn-helix transcriptional regulator [Microcoleus sp. PH2017_06_SFM_O_A]MCC3503521.1 helix-turn-helix transcriptional re